MGHNDENYFRHEKTGHKYVRLGVATNCTNAQDGQKMVLYKRADTDGPIFAREFNEFYEKFTMIP